MVFNRVGPNQSIEWGQIRVSKSVNAGGGLITLATAVSYGQTLLLINEVNQKEEKCTVIRQVSTSLEKTEVVVKFPQPVPDFWETTPP